MSKKREAYTLTFYQTCFGGTLQFETFGQELQGYAEMPVVSGSLERKALLEKLAFDKKKLLVPNKDDQKLIEVTDAFDVRWVLGA